MFRGVAWRGAWAAALASAAFIGAAVRANEPALPRLGLPIAAAELPLLPDSPSVEQTSQPTQSATSKEDENPAANKETGKHADKDKSHAVGSDFTLKAFWKEGVGLTFESAEKDFRVHVGGRFTVDFAWFGAGDEVQFAPGGVGELADGADFRRGRVRVDGTAYEVITWVSEFALDSALDGDTNHPGFIDVYLELNQLPYVGNFRAGNFREPFSMEALSGGNGLPLFERSSAFEAFVPFRNVGLMLWDAPLDERMTWATGVFRTNSRNTGNPFDYGDGEYSTTSRLTGLPWYTDNGRCLVHLGAAYSHRSYSLAEDQDRPRFRSFPEVRVGRYVMADTGSFAVESTDLFGAEFALNLGRFWVQSEYYHAWANDARLDDRITNPSFHGWYIQAGYFLTGESRIYRKNQGTLDRPIPLENFFLVRPGEESGGRRFAFGLGAWEAAFRYALVDVDDPAQGMDKQIVSDYTFGLTWYLNANTRIQWQYVLVDRDFPSEDNHGLVHVFATRFHIDF